MNGAFAAFLSLPEQDRRDVFAAAAVRLDTLPSYVEGLIRQYPDR